MTTMASGGWRARAAKVVPSPPAVVNSIKRTVTAIEPAWAGVAFDNSRLAGLAGVNTTAISLRWLALDHFGGKCREAAIIAVCITQIGHIVSTLDHPVITHSVLESLNKNCKGVRRTAYQKPNQRCRLLRARPERPRDRRAAA